MFVLAMKAPRRDVLRLLLGTLEYTPERQSEWLNRGQQPYRRLLEDGGSKRPQAVQASHEFELFPHEDPTAGLVRDAAYAVEGRRSLLSTLDELVLEAAVVAVVAAGAAGLAFGVLWGVLLAFVAVAVVAAARRRGTVRAAELVVWRQILEPVAWALYYPAQLAQRVLAAEEYSKNAGQQSMRDLWDEAESHIARDPTGHALPGHDEALADAHYLSATVLPRILGTLDSSRLLAAGLAARVEVASELVGGECARTLIGATRPRGAYARTTHAVSEQLATRAYSHLMGQIEGFMTLPRPPEGTGFDTPLRRRSEEPTFQALHASSVRLLETAEAAAVGQWPEPASEWSRPTSRRAQLLMGAFGVLVASVGLILQFVPEYARLGDALIPIGAALAPGTLGKVLKESKALHAKPAPS